MLPYRDETRRGILVGGSSHACVRVHNFLYGGVRLRYVGTVHSRFLGRRISAHARPATLSAPRDSLDPGRGGSFLSICTGLWPVDIVGILLSAGSGPAD